MRLAAREGLSDLLRLAAVALGYPVHLVASHSLRKGGAAAMPAVTNDIEVVKRFGGWKSDAIHAYLYTDLSADRAKEMLASRPVLQPQQYAQPAILPSAGSRCGGPSSNDPPDSDPPRESDDNREAGQARLQELERATRLTFIQKFRLRRQLEDC